MAKTLSQSSGRKMLEKKPAAKTKPEMPSKPKRLSKMGEWRLAHPNGVGGTYDIRAVMK